MEEMYPHYSSRRLTKEKLCSMKRQTFQLFCGTLLFVVCIILTIVLAAVLTRKSSIETSENPADFCSEFVHHQAIHTSNPHSRCEKHLPLADECTVTEQDSWISFLKGSPAWNRAVDQLTADKRKNVSSIIISPPMLIVENPCSFQISFDLQTKSPVQVYIDSSESGFVPITVTSDRCHYGVITNQSFLMELKSFRVVIISGDSIPSNATYASVTSHTCVSFKPIKTTATPTQTPNFVTVPRGELNLCSLELENREILCDWFSIAGLSNEQFQWRNVHHCLQTGVSKPFNAEEVGFLSARTNSPRSSDFIISPKIEGGSALSRVSFWYLAQCSGSVIRLYILPGHHDVNDIATGAILPKFEFPLTNISAGWTFKLLEIPIPSSYSSYHVVIEGSITRNGNCTGYFCHNMMDQLILKRPQEPLLALDEITVEARFEQCNISNPTIVDSIDCSFQNNTVETFCHWIPSLPGGLWFDPQFFIYTHWKLDNSGNLDDADHGAINDHLKGRGYVITYVHRNGSPQNYFRTPLLVANSRCSCHMNFMYLLRGFFAPRLQVNLVVGVENNQQSIPQWSVFGHQADDWLEGDVLLNLPTSKPFRIEFTSLINADSKSEVSIDDITFTNCDFRLMASSNASG